MILRFIKQFIRDFRTPPVQHSLSVAPMRASEVRAAFRETQAEES